MGILLVYDCTEENTFNNIQNWLTQIDQHALPNVRKVLIANKVDKPAEEHKIDSEQGRKLAEQHGLEFFECSAKTGQNVSQVFEKVGSDIIKDFQAQGIETNNTRAGGGQYSNRNTTDHSDMGTI